MFVTSFGPRRPWRVFFTSSYMTRASGGTHEYLHEFPYTHRTLCGLVVRHLRVLRREREEGRTCGFLRRTEQRGVFWNCLGHALEVVGSIERGMTRSRSRGER